MGFGAAFWLLWGRVFPDLLRGNQASRCLKDYYLPDQYSVLAIASNVKGGGPTYVEPFSTSGESIYPSGYYNLLGQVARGTDNSVLWAWNVVGITVVVGLLAMSVVWARSAAPGTRAWLLAPAPFLVGTLYWWGSGDWLYRRGNANIWPPSASLFSPGAENPALLVGGVGIIVLGIGLATPSKASARHAAIAGLLLGVTLHLHANIAVFCVVAGFLAMLADYLLTLASPVRAKWTLAGIAAAAVVLLVTPTSGFALRIGALLTAGAVALFADSSWRRQRARFMVWWVLGAVVASLPLSYRLFVQIASGNGYFYQRQESVASFDVSAPISRALLLLAPIWALVVVVTMWLLQTRRETRAFSILPLLLGLSGAGLSLTLGETLGARGLEWHRFLVYTSFFLTMTAAPVLWLMISDRSNRLVHTLAIGVGVMLAATLPTTVAFAAQQPGLICTPQEEIDAYREVHTRTARDELLLLDRCLPADRFKVFSGAHVAFYNLGIAPPVDLASTRRALSDLKAGVLPDDATLRGARATLFVTHTSCGGVAQATIRARFGAPTQRVALRNAAAFGFPSGLTLEVYRIDGARAS